MIHAARALGLRVMLGCMIESQLGIAPAAQLASLADWVDLDGHLLMADEPFTRASARGRARAALARAGLGRGAGRVSERLAIFAEGLFAQPQRQDRPRRDPLRHPRRGGGDRLDPGGRRPREVVPYCLRPVPIVATLGEAIARGADDAADRGRADRRQARPGLARRRCSRRSAPGWTSRRACTPCSATTPSWRRRPRARGRRAARPARGPADLTVPAGPAAGPTRVRVVHSVGSDCVIGKKVVTLELDRAARERGERSVFVPTGQTGIAIAGWGIAVDHVISDYMAGAGERLVDEGAERGDLLFVEGQGGALPPGLLRRHAGAAARLGARPAGARPQGGRHGASATTPTCRSRRCRS